MGIESSPQSDSKENPPQEAPKRPGGNLEGKPVQGPDGQWYDKYGEKIEQPKRPGGPLEGKPVQGPDGKWYDEFGKEIKSGN